MATKSRIEEKSEDSKRRRVICEKDTKTKNLLIDNGEENLSSQKKMTSDEEDNEDDVLNEEINIDFEGFTIEPNDFHGIQLLLKQLFIMLSMNISELTDLITTQSYIGSTLKMTADEENTVYGITTLVDVNKNKEKKCIVELFNSIKQKCKEVEIEKSKQFQDLLDNKICLLINERFINIPVEVSLPMYSCLRSEIEEAKSKGQLNNSDYFLLVTKSVKTVKDIEESANGYDDETSSTQFQFSKGKKRKSSKPRKQETLQFVNPEDEIFFEECSLAFSYPVTKATGFAVSGCWDVDDNAMNTLRTVMFIESKKFNHIINKIETMVHK